MSVPFCQGRLRESIFFTHITWVTCFTFRHLILFCCFSVLFKYNCAINKWQLCYEIYSHLISCISEFASVLLTFILFVSDKNVAERFLWAKQGRTNKMYCNILKTDTLLYSEYVVPLHVLCYVLTLDFIVCVLRCGRVSWSCRRCECLTGSWAHDWRNSVRREAWRASAPTATRCCVRSSRAWSRRSWSRSESRFLLLLTHTHTHFCRNKHWKHTGSVSSLHSISQLPHTHTHHILEKVVWLCVQILILFAESLRLTSQ